MGIFFLITGTLGSPHSLMCRKTPEYGFSEDGLHGSKFVSVNNEKVFSSIKGKTGEKKHGTFLVAALKDFCLQKIFLKVCQ